MTAPHSPEPEFSRRIDIRQCDGRQFSLAANQAERAALAKRFDLVRIDRLEAQVTLSSEGRTVLATGTVEADFVQSCAVSAEDLPASIDEEMTLRFVPAQAVSHSDEEVELDADACDEIEYTGPAIDLGEAVAQTMALAIDPFVTGPQAEAARALFKSESQSPFAALKGLDLPQKDGDEG